MSRSIIVLLVILALSALKFSPAIALNATYTAGLIEGTVNGGGCTVLGGTLLSDAIDAKQTQTIELCKFDDRYLRIVYYGGCTENIGQGKDPVTGKPYTFAVPCDVPKACDGSVIWGNNPVRGFHHVAKLNVKAEGKDFYILTGSIGILCSFESFILEEKKINIVLQAAKGTTGSIDVFIPQELMTGEFNVMVDGKDAEYEIERTQEGAKIIIEVDFPQGQREIDIIGTQVIPEFSTFGLIIFATAISLIIATRLMPKLK